LKGLRGMMTSRQEELFIAVRAGDHERVRAVLENQPELVHARDTDGATPLHYAAEAGDRRIVNVLLDAGADINARDTVFDATPAGWAIEYLRQRGALLAIEIDDLLRAIADGDAELVRWYISRLPALRDAVDKDGVPLRVRAQESRHQAVRQAFDR